MRSTTSSTCAPTRPGRPPGLLRDSPARARSRMSTPSWRTGAQTTALSATATSAKTSSRSRACSESPLRCTTSPTRTSTVRTHGLRSARRTSRVQTIEPAPPTVRCINKIKIKSSVRKTGRNFYGFAKLFNFSLPLPSNKRNCRQKRTQRNGQSIQHEQKRHQI